MQKWLSLALCLPVWMILTAQSCKDSFGSISGKVSFKGVPCQAGQPDFHVPPCSGPYPQYEIQIFTVTQTETPVLTLKSGLDGQFQADLPAGEYVIFTQNGPFEKHKKQNFFVVVPKQTSTVNLLINTGIL